MGKEFEDPYSFAWNAGENLLLNGIDIFEKIYDAIDDWGNKKYYQFGVDIGEALAEVADESAEQGLYLASEQSKHQINSVLFLRGYIESHTWTWMDEQGLNNIENLGGLIYQPIVSAAKVYENDKTEDHEWQTVQLVG